MTLTATAFQLALWSCMPIRYSRDSKLSAQSVHDHVLKQ